MLATPADYPRVLKYLGKVAMDKTGEKFDGSNTLKWQQLMRAVTVELQGQGLLAVVEGQVKIMVTSSVPRPGVTQQVPLHSVLLSSEPRGDRSSSSRTPSMLQRALALHQVGHLGDVLPSSLPRSIGELQVQHLANATPTGTLQPQRVLQQSALQQAPSLPMQALPGLSPDQQISGNTTMAPLSQSLPLPSATPTTAPTPTHNPFTDEGTGVVNPTSQHQLQQLIVTNPEVLDSRDISNYRNKDYPIEFLSTMTVAAAQALCLMARCAVSTPVKIGDCNGYGADDDDTGAGNSEGEFDGAYSDCSSLSLTFGASPRRGTSSQSSSPPPSPSASSSGSDQSSSSGDEQSDHGNDYSVSSASSDTNSTSSGSTGPRFELSSNLSHASESEYSVTADEGISDLVLSDGEQERNQEQLDIGMASAEDMASPQPTPRMRFIPGPGRSFPSSDFNPPWRVALAAQWRGSPQECYRWAGPWDYRYTPRVPPSPSILPSLQPNHNPMSGYNSASTPAFMVTAVSDSNGNCQRQTGFDNGGVNADQALAAQIAADTLQRRRSEAATLITAIWRPL